MKGKKPKGDEEYERWLYTTGGCPWLAYALHKELGWPMAMLVDEGRPDTWGKGEELPTIYHVFVETPRMTALDIMGERTYKELKEHYHDLIEPRIVYVTTDELGRLMADDMPLEMCPLDEEPEARKVAKRIARAVTKK